MSRRLELVIHEGTREVARRHWTGQRLLIGRHPEADIRVHEPTMSAKHAEIVAQGGGVAVRDLDSLNGTLLNGVRVKESILRAGDEIEIGLARIEVVWSRAPERSERESREDNLVSTQTVKVQLDQLRAERGEELEEDERILHLRDLFEALKSAEDQDQLLEQVRRVLARAYHHARVFLLRSSADGQWQDPDVESDGRNPSLTFTNEAARTNSAILSTSLPDDQRFSAATSVRISGIETAIAAPASCDGEVVAVLYVDRLGLPPFDRRDLNLLGITANHVSAVLESVSRFSELRHKTEEIQAGRERLAELNRTLEKRVEERTGEIRRQAEEIQRLAEAKDELLGIAAHDIRGPLTVIQGTTELLLLRADSLDEGTLKRSLEMVHDASRGLSQLLSELLDAKAIEAGIVTLRHAPITIDELLHRTLPVAQLAADDKSIRLEVRSEADVAVECDAQRLSQAITNLLLNAVKFSKAGSRILLEGRRHEDERILISVEDQGIGIPESEIERIFGSFEQGQAGRQLGGSGLGLMIARRIVELHSGALSVESKVGVGTRFSLTLPIRPPAGPPNPRRVLEEDSSDAEATPPTEPDVFAPRALAPRFSSGDLEPLDIEVAEADLDDSEPIGF